MLLSPAHSCAPVEPVRCLLEAGVLPAVAECCEDGGCDEEVFGADAERDRLRGASCGHRVPPEKPLASAMGRKGRLHLDCPAEARENQAVDARRAGRGFPVRAGLSSTLLVLRM